MSSANSLKEGALIVNILMIIGFLGLVWLMIFGNLGISYFDRETASYSNETITLSDTGATPSSLAALYEGTIVATGIIVTNASGGEEIVSANYTVTGNVFTNATGEYGGQSVNVSYSATYDGSQQQGIDEVILNNTGGVTTFFSYAPIWFIITAITVLIAILIGLLLYSIKILRLTRSKGSFSE